MGKYLDIADEWKNRNPRPAAIDGHEVKEVLLQTAMMIIFRDSDGKLWRRVHSWGMTWPFEIDEGKDTGPSEIGEPGDIQSSKG